MLRIFFFILLTMANTAHAENFWFYKKNDPAPIGGTANLIPGKPTYTQGSGITVPAAVSYPAGTQANFAYVTLASCVNNTWTVLGSYPGSNYLGSVVFEGERIGTTYSTITLANIQALHPTCPIANPCASKTDQASDPILVNLPYHAQYYETVGICQDGCIQKPSGSVILDKFARDGSGYAVGPWKYTGQQCVEGVTPSTPAQPTEEEKCDALRNACESTCQGRAYTFNCTTGECECFGAPGYTNNPPDDPTTPTGDPGAPTTPNPETPTTDPGVTGNQLGAVISNQGKQIGQNNAEIGQLGAINSKLGAVISNQGKQIGQTDKLIDYARKQLDAQEGIESKLDEMLNGESPELPGDLELDGTIPDTKNWTEYDDAESIGIARANKQIQDFEENEQEMPFNLTINTNGSVPYLHGPMFGREIQIRFDRPWMETGYAIMKGLLISIGYLQAFLMVHRVVTGA